MLKLFLIKFSGFNGFASKNRNLLRAALSARIPDDEASKAHTAGTAAIQLNSPSSDGFRATLQPGAALTAPCEAKFHSEKSGLLTPPAGERLVRHLPSTIRRLSAPAHRVPSHGGQGVEMAPLHSFRNPLESAPTLAIVSMSPVSAGCEVKACKSW